MRYVDYIQNGPDDGNSSVGWQIDLGYKPSANMVIKLGISYPTSAVYTGPCIFGNYKGGANSSQNYVRLFAHRNYDLTYDNPRDGNCRVYLPITFGVKKNIELGVYPTCYIKDLDTGTVVNGSGSYGYNYDQNLKILQDWNNTGNIQGCRFYYVELYENDTMVRQYLPVINDSGRTGMYETITGNFYTNTGTPYTYALSISIDPTTALIDSTGDTIDVEVSSENDWEATFSDGSWFSLSQTGGTSADTAITITIDENQESSSREDTIVFEDVVTQDGVSFSLKQRKFIDGQPMYIGTSEISEFYLGTSEINEMYLGTELVFSTSSPTPTGNIIEISNIPNLGQGDDFHIDIYDENDETFCSYYYNYTWEDEEEDIIDDLTTAEGVSATLSNGTLTITGDIPEGASIYISGTRDNDGFYCIGLSDTADFGQYNPYTVTCPTWDSCE